MSDPDRVSLAFIWDANSPRFNRHVPQDDGLRVGRRPRSRVRQQQ